MFAEFWPLAVLSFFYIAAQLSLSRKEQCDLDEAALLPFADDPEVLRRMREASPEQKRRATSIGSRLF